MSEEIKKAYKSDTLRTKYLGYIKCGKMGNGKMSSPIGTIFNIILSKKL